MRLLAEFWIIYVILGLGEEMNGINVLDHIEVFGRFHGFSNDALHVMPVEVFGSRRQGRTTSIYNLLGRAGDTSAPSQHPLLVEPSSSCPVLSRQAGTVIMTTFGSIMLLLFLINFICECMSAIPLFLLFHFTFLPLSLMIHVHH